MSTKDVPNLTQERINFKPEQSAPPRFILAQAGDEAVAVKVADVDRLILRQYSANNQERWAVDARMTKGESITLSVSDTREEAILKLKAAVKVVDPGAVTL